MWVYIKAEPGLYAVGFYKPDGTWVPESDHADQADAIDRVNYLNGPGRVFQRNRVTMPGKETTVSLTLEEARFLRKQLGADSVFWAKLFNSAWVTDEVVAEALASLGDVFVQRLTMATGVRYSDYGQLTGLPKQSGEGTITQGQSTATKAITSAFCRLCDAIEDRRPPPPRKHFIKRLTCPHCGLEVQIAYQLQKPTPEQSSSDAEK